MRRNHALGAMLALLVGASGCATDSTTDPGTATEPATSSTITSSSTAPSTTTSSTSPSSTRSTRQSSSTTTSSPTGSSPALVTLETLPVKGRAPKTGYDRAMFGQAWSDDVTVDGGHNGCDTRNDVLRRDLTGLTIKPGTHGCVVLRGALADPYTGRDIPFVRGTSTSAAVQIDHVVSLSNAWQTGAQQLSVGQRQDLANDPLNLLAVDGPTNAQKGDGDAATWLPPRGDHRCDFAARQVAVKATHDLWVTSSERAALRRLLTPCPGQRLPSPGQTRVPALGAAPATTAPRPTPAPSSTTASGDVHYENCTAAREAGAAPVRRGDPGYGRHLDRDGDGTGCE